ncbi:hypothetical protein TCDM_13641 [Trypanosoma cruzi Dm28c]|uniref:Uncharacterized protein n=1 Tax=Trypanosoma cruzi Dm28c TaxID=1416333 RepID=V5AI49_TRYCR|nr:hypothetical protein TCDM_13641 [Trypanosoma cruzi Dm28c]
MPRCGVIAQPSAWVGKRRNSGVRPPGGRERLHRSVLHDANTPRPVPGVVCGPRDEVLGTPLCHTVCPLETQHQSCPFQSHSWRWRHPLPRCVLVASVTMLQCDKRCPAEAVLRWVGKALRGHRADKPDAAAPTAADTQKKKSSTPCHVLVRDGSAFQSNTATRRSAFPQKMRATAPSQCIFLFHFRGMQQLPAPSAREASSCTATCTPCGCVSAGTQIKKRATHVKKQKKTQRSYRTDKEKRKKPAKAQEGTAAQPTATHNTLAETKNKNLKNKRN